MYAQPNCVESVLWMAHRCWSLLHEREDEFQNLYNDLNSQPGASRGYYFQYLDKLSDFTECNNLDAFKFIFARWSTISATLGLKTPESWDHLTTGSS
jgi:hypothetical protein